MPHLSRRRLAALAAGTALIAGPLVAVGPSTASASAPSTDTSRRAVTLVAACSGSRPVGGFGFMTIRHRFPLPANGTWKRRYERDRTCMYQNPRAKLRISWVRGAGSWKAMKRRVNRARSRPGFRLQQLHRHGVRFDSHTNHTRIAEFTFRNARGKRQHVRIVGDRYTMLWARSSQRAWRHGIGRTANRAHRGMHRFIAIAM